MGERTHRPVVKTHVWVAGRQKPARPDLPPRCACGKDWPCPDDTQPKVWDVEVVLSFRADTREQAEAKAQQYMELAESETQALDCEALSWGIGPIRLGEWD